MAKQRVTKKVSDKKQLYKMHETPSLFSETKSEIRGGSTVVVLSSCKGWSRVTGNAVGTGKLVTGYIKSKHIV